MKGRLREPALAAPEFAFAYEQPLPEKSADDLLGQVAFVKLPLLDHQNLLDKIRVIQKDAVLERDGQERDVAVFARNAAKGPQRIFADGEGQAKQRQSLRSRREACCSCAHIPAS
jgi:hypothetical protein